MPSFQPRLLISGAFLLVGLYVCPVPADDADLDILYAERMPLATESLLLDITERPGGGFVAVGERGHVVFSADGKAWRQADIVPTRTTLTTVAAAGDRIWAAGHDAVIITSGDHGLTWTLQHRDRERQQAIMDLHFSDENTGMALGSYGLALVTDNGGHDWEDSLVNEEDWHNNALLVEGEFMLVAGEAGFSYRSFDGGLSWETIEMPYPGSMFGVVRSGEACYMVFGLRGNAQESCDQGETWEELDTGTQLTIAGGVRHGDEVVLVGNSGLVLTRKDGGEFEVFSHSSGVDFAEVVAAGDDHYLLVGEDGIHRFPEKQEPEE